MGRTCLCLVSGGRLAASHGRNSARRRSGPQRAHRGDRRHGRTGHQGHGGASGTGSGRSTLGRTGTGIEIEHLRSDFATGVFSALAAATPTPATARATTRPVLLAGMADDQHRLPIVVLSATLAQRGVACRSMGADLPTNALIATIRRTAPVAIPLWSQLPETAHLPSPTRPGFRTLRRRTGWADIALAPQIARLNSLQEATNTPPVMRRRGEPRRRRCG